MADILVQLQDYSMMRVQCDRSIAAELSDYFSFYVPNYKYMPAYRNRVWDGKIRLFNSMTNELNAGLFAYLSKFAEQRNYLLDVVDGEYGFPNDTDPLDLDHFNAFVDTLSAPYTPRDYQHTAVTTMLQHRRGIILSPTGSGKSFIIYLMIRYLLDNINGKILVIVPTTSLVEQMYNDFKDYNYDVDSNVHRIYSGKEKNTDKRVVVSTWQSIYKFPKKWFDQFEGIFGDECHGFKSKSLSSIMNKSTQAKYRYGTTGTLDGTLTHKLVLEGLFGPCYQVTTTKQLQDNNTLADLDISVVVLEYDQQTRENWGKRTYQQEVEFIVKHDKRNNFIRNLALDQHGNTLVLFRLTDKHGKVLYDLIKDKAADGRKVFYVAGDVATDDREAVRKIVENQTDAIIVASLGTFSTGINIRNLHNIIFASPSKSQIKVLQSIGRGLRKSDNQVTTKLFDIADDLHWKSNKNFTLLHSGERIKIYQKEQFKYKIVKVKM